MKINVSICIQKNSLLLFPLWMFSLMSQFFPESQHCCIMSGYINKWSQGTPSKSCANKYCISQWHNHSRSNWLMACTTHDETALLFCNYSDHFIDKLKEFTVYVVEVILNGKY